MPDFIAQRVQVGADGVIQNDIPDSGADATYEFRSHSHFELHFLIRQSVEGVEQFQLLFGREFPRDFEVYCLIW